jgi:Ser/Thr protein kinase RdoA (MazF antagonist)
MPAAFPETPGSIERVCAAWLGGDAVRAWPLAAGGLSGVSLYAVEHLATGRRFVLKRFHASATIDRCTWVHALMRQLRAAGIDVVPEVIDRPEAPPETRTLLVDHRGGPWELVAFMPGRATERPTAGQAAAAMQSLARLHVAAAAWIDGGQAQGPAPGVIRRREQARQLLAMPWRQRRAAIAGDADPVVVAIFAQAIDVFESRGGARTLEAVVAAKSGAIPLQPVLRDVWSDHVLFDEHGGRVTGIVDYHAAAIDTPATDLARLLGSWSLAAERCERPLLEAWRDAIDAYEEVRPLASAERRLIPWLHATGVILGLDNWFRWTLEEGRTFPDAPRMHKRITRLVAALRAM